MACQSCALGNIICPDIDLLMTWEVVLLIVLLYVLVKACNLIIRTIAKYPTNRVLWVSLILFLVCAVLTVITKGNTLCAVLTALSFLLLWAIAYIMELYYNDLFQEQTPLVQSVLRKPWWQGAQQQLAA
jgi:hypothetical protein